MKPELEKLADFLQLNLSRQELEDFIWNLQVRAKDEYYKEHPEAQYGRR